MNSSSYFATKPLGSAGHSGITVTKVSPIHGRVINRTTGLTKFDSAIQRDILPSMKNEISGNL